MGEVIFCILDIKKLTKYNGYNVLLDVGGCYGVVDDSGRFTYYPKGVFMTLKEFRLFKIKQILKK